MEKLSRIYAQYFALQEERYEIEYSKKNWIKYGLADYAEMVDRVNEISPKVRRIAAQIKEIETALEDL